MVAKGPRALRSISEAAAELGVAPHVLRFWETRFAFVRPMTGVGGRRFYRPEDLALLRGVRALLHDEGYTIKGVQRLHREEGVRRVATAGEPPPASPEPLPQSAAAPSPRLDGARKSALAAVLADLEGAKAAVDRLLGTPRESRLPPQDGPAIRRLP